MERVSWKRNNTLTKYRESTPVDERDDYKKWQKDYDSRNSVETKRAKFEAEANTRKNNRWRKELEKVVEAELEVFSEYFDVDNFILERAVDIIVDFLNPKSMYYYNRNYYMSPKFAETKVNFCIVDFPSKFFTDSGDIGYSIKLALDFELYKLIIDEDFSSAIDYIKKNGLTLFVKAHLETIPPHAESYYMKSRNFRDALCSVIYADTDGDDNEKYFDLDKKPISLLKVLSNHGYRKLADCINNGLLTVCSLYDDTEVIEITFRSSTKILKTRDDIANVDKALSQLFR